MTLNEKASYIKGLVDGFNLDKEKNENKAIYAIIDFLDDMTESIAKLEDSVDDIQDEIEDINDDIEELGEKDDVDYGISDDNIDSDLSETNESEDMYYEIECPSCNTKVCLSEDTLSNSNINCPNCGNEININVNSSCECEDCNCGDCNCDS